MTTSLRPYINLFDEGFDVGKTLEYRLTIQFALGGFSYTILDASDKTLIAMEAYLSDDLLDDKALWTTLEKSFVQNKINGRQFKSVTCIIENRVFAMVPTEMFDETNPNAYLEFLHSQTQKTQVLSSKLKTTDCVDVYSFSEYLSERIREKWANAQFTHCSEVFLNHVARFAQREKATGIYIYVMNRSFNMAISKDGVITFFNNFKFNTKDDFLYFLLFAIEQQGFIDNLPTVYVSGMIQANSEIMKLCERYIKHLRFIPNGTALKVSDALKEIPSQYYYIPYQVLQCES